MFFKLTIPTNLRCGLHRARESVCRVSGFVQVGFWDAVSFDVVGG